MIDYEQLFNDSFERVRARGDRFYARFYELFLSADPRVAQRFAHTDMAAQRQMLHESLAYVVAFSAKKQAGTYLQSVAHRHGDADLAIPRELFELWLECLLQAVGELDPRFNDDVQSAWRVMLAPGLAFMTAGEANARVRSS